MSNNGNKEKFISQAQKLVEKGQFDKAIREYLKAVSEDGNDIRIWIRIGDLYVKLGQKNEAVENYKKVAQLYVQQSEPEKAVAVYKRILEISPQSVDAHLSLGALYREQGRVGHATQQYEMASQALYRLGKIRDALRAEQAIVDLMPDSVARRIKLAELYSKENMFSDAAREFATAAAYLRNADRMDDYAKVAERLLFHAPENLEALKELARHYLKSGDTPRALTRLQAGFKRDQKDPEILDLLAEAFAALGKTDKSIAVLKELSRIYSERGALAAARSTWQRILSLDPNDADARAAINQNAAPVKSGLSSGPLHAKLFNSPEPQSIPSAASGGGATPLSAFSSRVLNSAPHLISPPGSLPATQRTPPAGSMGAAQPGMLTASSISTRLTPAAGSALAPPSSPEEEAARLVAEADSFLRFGLTKKALEHLQGALARNAGLRPVRERLAKLYESQRDYKSAIAELRALLSQCIDPQEEVRYLREILRLDNQDQDAGMRLKVITGMHRLTSEPVLADDFDEPEISVTTGEGEARLAPAKSAKMAMAPSDGVPEEMLPSANTRPNAAEVEAVAEELALTSGTLKEELDEVDFFLQQKLFDDARRLLQALAGRYPHSKTVAAKLKQLENPNMEVVIDVDMADVHEELLVSAADAPIEPARSSQATPSQRSLQPTPSQRSLQPAPSQRSLQPPQPALATPASGRSLPGEPGPSSPVTAAQYSLQPTQRSLPPPPPRPSRQMKTLASSDASGAFRLGVSFRNRGQYEQAIGEFEKALGDPKRGSRAALMTGLCYRDQNRIKQAIEVFKLGIHMPDVSDNDLSELYYQLGRSYEVISDAKEAIHFYQSAMRSGRFRDAAERIAALQKAPK